MDRTGSRARDATAIVVAILLAGCAASPGSPAPSPQATGAPGSPSDPAPSATPVATPTAPPPQVGLAWTVVDDPDVASYPNRGVLHGVIAGGPGAIAWGETWGPAGANGGEPALGPKIWTTADGHDWVPASIEAPIAAPAYPGAVVDIASGGPGYVAIGSYFRIRTGLVTAIWTSPDARTWRLNPDDPALDRSLVHQVLRWHGGLLAIGCALISAMDCGDARLWTSTDGARWVPVGADLRSGVVLVRVVASTDRLWARGLNQDEGMMAASTPPPMLTSTDGRTWEVSPLPVLGYGDLHSLPAGLYYTVAEVPVDPTWEPAPSWVTRIPGVYRSTDLAAWEPMVVGHQLGEEIVAFGDTLVMVGTTGTRCWYGANCVAAAWRSTDEGRTWKATPVTGSTPKDRPGGTISALAELPDGTLVGVGELFGKDMTATATWVSAPQLGP